MMNAAIAAIALAAAHPAAPNPYAAEDTPADELAGGWTYSSAVDPMTDLLEASVSLYSSDSRYRITLSCRSGTRDRPMSFRLSGPRYLGGDATRVVARVDRGKAWAQTWDNQGRVAFTADAWDVSGLILLLSAGGRRVAFRVYDYAGQPGDSSFDLTGSAAAFDRALNDCGQGVLRDRALRKKPR